MSRSNTDKPFYVDVGTSIVAIRCQSNHDVIDRINYVRLGNVYIEMANNMCDRMNAEVDKVVAERDAENSKLRSLVKELTDELEKFHAWEEARALVDKASEVIRKDKTNDTY